VYQHISTVWWGFSRASPILVGLHVVVLVVLNSDQRKVVRFLIFVDIDTISSLLILIFGTVYPNLRVAKKGE